MLEVMVTDADQNFRTTFPKSTVAALHATETVQSY